MKPQAYYDLSNYIATLAGLFLFLFFSRPVASRSSAARDFATNFSILFLFLEDIKNQH